MNGKPTPSLLRRRLLDWTELLVLQLPGEGQQDLAVASASAAADAQTLECAPGAASPSPLLVPPPPPALVVPVSPPRLKETEVVLHGGGVVAPVVPVARVLVSLSL